MILKAPSRRGQGTLHVAMQEARTGELVANTLQRQLEGAYGLASEDMMYPVLVSQCMKHQDTIRNGMRERFYDFRIIVVADGVENAFKAIPAFARSISIPATSDCPNKTMCHLPIELARRERYVPLANESE